MVKKVEVDVSEIFKSDKWCERIDFYNICITFCLFRLHLLNSPITTHIRLVFCGLFARDNKVLDGEKM